MSNASSDEFQIDVAADRYQLCYVFTQIAQMKEIGRHPIIFLHEDNKLVIQYCFMTSRVSVAGQWQGAVRISKAAIQFFLRIFVSRLSKPAIQRFMRGYASSPKPLQITLSNQQLCIGGKVVPHAWNPNISGWYRRSPKSDNWLPK